MKKTNLVFVIVLLGFFALGLTGLSLAGVDGADAYGVNAADARKETGRLVGMFVTTEHLDLMDVEGYLNDHLTQAVLSGGQLRMEDTDEYQGRIYAELVQRPLTNAKTGDVTEHWEYVFPLEGVGYFAYYYAEDGEGYWATSTGDGLVDAATHWKSTDVGEGVEMDGTLYCSPAAAHVTAFVNPVYQLPDGRVYLLSGSGFDLGGAYGEGEIWATNLKESQEETLNGRTKDAWDCSVTLHISLMYWPQSYIVWEMSEDSQVLSRREYNPGHLPKELELGAETAFVLLESQRLSPEGETVTERTVYEPGEEYMESFHCREDGLCVPDNTTLIWP